MSGDKHTSTSNIAEADPETAPSAGDYAEAKPKHPPAAEAGGSETPVAEESPAEGDGGETTVRELKKALDTAKRTADSHWDAVLRTRAELENLRKRSERELENAHKFGLERMITELLPVKDSLELGLAAGEGDDARLAKLREGMELTLKMFTAALEKFGVSEINPEGEAFDPQYHQAMTVQEADGQSSNTVISVIQKGYVLNDRLVRPALVIVAK